MRFQPELSTYQHSPQRKKKEQKERNDYDYAFNLHNPEGTIHVLLKGDILTCYEHRKQIIFTARHFFQLEKPPKTYHRLSKSVSPED